MIKYPRIVVDLEKIKKNMEFFVSLSKANGVELAGVTKVFSGNLEIAKLMKESGIKYIADSRIENLISFEKIDLPKILLRLPMKSQVEEVVKYSDISLNSEISTIKLLDDESKKQDKIHRVILMLELGDLREGILPRNIYNYVEEILKLKNIKLEGVGVNLTCYGGIIPSGKNLGELEDIANFIEEKYSLKLDIISGGNSSSIMLLQNNKLPSKINNLRLGEALYFGRETAYGNDIEGCYNNTIKLEVEIIELKEKKSYPTGEIGLNAFGKKPIFEDKGPMKRAIVAIGQQDVNKENLELVDEKIKIIGASSDHMVLDLTNVTKKYSVGDIIEFKLDYGSLLQLATSKYVNKVLR